MALLFFNLINRKLADNLDSEDRHKILDKFEFLFSKTINIASTKIRARAQVIVIAHWMTCIPLYSIVSI